MCRLISDSRKYENRVGRSHCGRKMLFGIGQVVLAEECYVDFKLRRIWKSSGKFEVVFVGSPTFVGCRSNKGSGSFVGWNKGLEAVL